MYRSIIGTSIVTFIICLLPTHESLGFLAPALFAMLRALQCFFLGGEYNGGAIYCLEHEGNDKRHGLVSGLYCAFAVAGIIFASIVATICTLLGPQYFRCAYAVSFLLAFFIYKTRAQIRETPEFRLRSDDNRGVRMRKHNLRGSYLSIALASLFFGVIYGLPTRIFNALLPLTVHISTNEIMIINTVFLLVYMVLLIVFGNLASIHGAKKIMFGAVAGTLVFSFPLMQVIDSKNISGIIFAKAIFATFAAAFIGPFHDWAQRQFPSNHRYSGISISYCLGKCGSTIILACSILIFDRYHNVSSLGIIFVCIAVVTLGAFHEGKSRPKPEALHDYSR